MTVVGVTMVRDEEDVIVDVVTAMLGQVDAVIVCDNLSSDSTPALLAQLAAAYPERVALTVDSTFAFHQSEAVTRLARQAIEQFAADWIVPFDADEVWLPIGEGTLRDALGRIDGDRQVAWGNVADHIVTPGGDGGPIRSMRWRERTVKAWIKVAARAWSPIIVGSGSHTAKYSAELTDVPVFLVHHFPYRSPAQIVRKVREGLKATDANGQPDPEDDPTPHLRDLGRGSDAQIVEQFHAGWYREQPDPRVYVEDPVVGVPSVT